MSLELLREKFGYSGVTKEEDNREKIHEKLSTRFTYKKEVDNEEKIHEKLNGHFNPMGDIKSIKVQHQEQLDEKQKIIENLQTETSELTNEVVTLKKEKAVLLDDLNKSRWMEDKVHLTAKKLYEDKLKKMEFVDSTELIPMLISVSRKKQGNTKLNWGNWLKISENKYLFQINESLAKKVFEDTNVLIDRAVGFINRKRTRAGDDLAKNYSLTFFGDTNTSTRKGDLVATDFNPDDFSLATNGFTISYWVRPDEVGADMFAIGRKAHNNERFTFGMSQKQKGYFGVGANQSERAWSTMLDTAGIDKATHLVQDTDDKWILVVGRWYHFAVTYAGTDAGTNNMLRKIYMNGQQIWGTGVSDPDNKGNINWSQTGTEMSKGMSFGMRAVRGSGGTASYNNGRACGLDEVAIYDTEHDADWVAGVYSGQTNYDHTGASNLVGYWKFNEGSGTTVKDLSGNGNHGLLTNDTYGDDGGAAWVDENDTPTWEEIESYK